MTVQVMLNGDLPLEIQCAVPIGFPSHLPVFLVPEMASLPRIPHLMPNGWLCYHRREGMVINMEDPQGVLRWAVGRAIEVLEEGIRGENHGDFLEEYAVYWRQIAGHQTMIWNGKVRGEARKVKRLVSQKGIVVCMENESRWEGPLGLLLQNENWTEEKGIYIPISETTSLPLPPATGMWSPEALRGILERQMTHRQIKLLGRLLNAGKFHFAVIALFSSHLDAPVLIGVEAKFEGGQRRFSPLTNPIELSPINVERMDNEYLIQRGGGDASLASKGILLLGAGSVGGYIAHALAKTGIGSLSILDRDVLLPENTHRHVLGFSILPVSKSEAIAGVLQMQHPFLKIEGVAGDVELVLNMEPTRFNDFDLIIVATGDPTTDLRLNEFFQQHECPPVIFTWVEALGLGGHALVTRLGGSAGCLRCLYEQGENGPQNRASFAAPGQHFERTIDGCGSAFTPFGALDANQTAILCVRMAVQVLTGEQTENCLRSWKGDGSEFRRAGFETSDRFNLTEGILLDQLGGFQSSACPVCARQFG
jgi:molybdopterin/thiamine biosynthesis adenylyltransferase